MTDCFPFRSSSLLRFPFLSFFLSFFHSSFVFCFPIFYIPQHCPATILYPFYHPRTCQRTPPRYILSRTHLDAFTCTPSPARLGPVTTPYTIHRLYVYNFHSDLCLHVQRIPCREYCARHILTIFCSQTAWHDSAYQYTSHSRFQYRYLMTLSFASHR